MYRCALICGVGGLLGCTPTPEPLPPPSLDIVLVVIDTLRADHLGVYGYERDTSPNLDALAATGSWYSRAYAHSSWTLASMASLFTGLLPHQHRVVRDPAITSKFGRLSNDIPTLAGLLKERGYATGAVVSNTYLAPEFGLHRGFDWYDYQGANNVDHRLAAEGISGGLDWLDTQKGASFLLLHFMEPHLDYNPPADLQRRYTPEGEPVVEIPYGTDWAWSKWQNGAPPPPDEEGQWIVGLYDAEIRAVDRDLGALVSGLAKRGRTDRTLLVVTSDHGEEFWDHGGFEHGHSLLGEVTRVPLLVSGPDVGVGRVDTVVQHTDLFEGLLYRAGVAGHGPGLFAFAPGAPVLERVAISEDTLYGPPRVSIVNSKHRVVYNQERKRAAVWPVSADGAEGEALGQHEQPAIGGPMMEHLEKIRGDLEPIDNIEGPILPSTAEIWVQLQSLGYVTEP